MKRNSRKKFVHGRKAAPSNFLKSIAASFTAPACPCRLLETGINMIRASTLRGVAGDIDKRAFFLAFRADLRRFGCGYGETAMRAFPVSQAAVGAYIPFKSAIGRVAASRTYPFPLLFFHFFSHALDIRHAGRSRNEPRKTLLHPG